MAATVESYLTLVAKAYDGRLQLPAFQRDYKWKPSQVTLLYDSLRQGYPIGGFLFIKKNPAVNLGPRDFKGAIKEAHQREAEFLVLDGQQRITAGIELFYGSERAQYYLDLGELFNQFNQRGFTTEDPKQIRKFLEDLDTDVKYCFPRKSVDEPEQYLFSKHWLPTTYLANDDDLTRVLKKYRKKYPEREAFVELVIDKNFRPSKNISIPITSIEDDVTVESISRIFSTLNSTGRMLTPFELVVSILYPQEVKLVEDVKIAHELYPYYKRIDADGDILLQSIALFDGKDTKKAALPKTIDARNYRLYSNEVLKYLNESAKLLTEQLGLGLDTSDELLVYPVIFPPMAFLLKEFSGDTSVVTRASIERKISKWFIGAILARRYQQSTHDKQAKDKTEIRNWLADGSEPDWLASTYVPNLKSSDPDSAIGKLLRALMNHSGVRDPLTGRAVGVGSGKEQGQKHHIFPTKFVKHLSGWNQLKGGDSNNIALNIMYVEQATNASWLNNDPAHQIAESIKVRGSEQAVRDIYSAHGIESQAFDILRKPNKVVDDFFEFINLRETYFFERFKKYNFIQATIQQNNDDDILDDE